MIHPPRAVRFNNYALSTTNMIQDFAHDPCIKLMRGDILRVNELSDALDGVQDVVAVAGSGRYRSASCNNSQFLKDPVGRAVK